MRNCFIENHERNTSTSFYMPNVVHLITTHLARSRNQIMEMKKKN